MRWLKMTDDRLEELKRRRVAKAEEREHARLREKNGAAILDIMRDILGTDFREVPAVSNRPHAELSKRIEQSKGLVAAYVSYPRAQHILGCCQAVLGGEVSTDIWFDEKSYMGIFSCARLRLPRLVDLAMKVEDRIFAAPIAASGILIVDYYDQSWTVKQTDFSIILQGASIEQTFQNCFAQQSTLQSRLLGPNGNTSG
jgi:hypothetical protein